MEFTKREAARRAKRGREIEAKIRARLEADETLSPEIAARLIAGLAGSVEYALARIDDARRREAVETGAKRAKIPYTGFGY